jgi:tetratricopeptide (TPR) repeat protein
VNQEGILQASLSQTEVDRGITIGRDAIGNVLVTGDRNNVQVTLVVADRRLLASLTPDTTARKPTDNPYRGLDAFYETNTAWFFGRAKLAARAWVLFQNLQRGSSPRILAVVGASGSGKSSLVRAGFIPQIARQPMEGLDSPKVLVLRPGPTPLQQLSQVLARLTGTEVSIEDRIARRSPEGKFDGVHEIVADLSGPASSRVIIVIDQFEELFTECGDNIARSIFLENLGHAAAASDKLISVILTLRSDFASVVKSPTWFATAVRDNKLFVGPMDHDELTQAISIPAQRLGHAWPAPLVESLVAQAEGRAGALPLLSFALRHLWPDQIDGHLDEARWSSRLIEDFLVEAADVLYEKSGNAGSERARNQEIIRNAFVAMVQFGEGVSDTRRVARLSEFVTDGESAERVRIVLAPFTAPEARLVTASEQEGEPTYELTHEALISSWERLRTWLGNVPDKFEAEKIRRNLRLYRRLSIAAADWKSGTGSLWHSRELQQLPVTGLSKDQADFVSASRWDIRRRMFTVASLATAVVLLLGAIATRFVYAEYVKRTALDCDLMAAEHDNDVGVSGVDFDKIVTAKAIPACQSAVDADPENPRLIHNLARSLDRAGNVPDAMRWYSKAADKGWAWSENNLGIMYLSQAAHVDFKKAIPLLRAAAEQNNDQAIKNYTDTDYSSLFTTRSDRARMLERALVEKGFLNPAYVQGRWNAGLQTALADFKQAMQIPDDGVSLRVIDKLGVADDLTATAASRPSLQP